MTRKIASRIAALAATAALLSACGASSPIQTAENYAPSDGVRVEFSNGVRFENFFLLTASEGEPIRLMGSIVNASSSPTEVTIDVGGTVQTHTVAANSVLSLQSDGAIIQGVDALPVWARGAAEALETAGIALDMSEPDAPLTRLEAASTLRQAYLLQNSSGQ